MRIPVRQARTKKWPVLDLDKWRFELTGWVDSSAQWTWDDLQKLPRVKVFADKYAVSF